VNRVSHRINDLRWANEDVTVQGEYEATPLFHQWNQMKIPDEKVEFQEDAEMQEDRESLGKMEDDPDGKVDVDDLRLLLTKAKDEIAIV